MGFRYHNQTLLTQSTQLVSRDPHVRRSPNLPHAQDAGISISSTHRHPGPILSSRANTVIPGQYCHPGPARRSRAPDPGPSATAPKAPLSPSPRHADPHHHRQRNPHQIGCMLLHQQHPPARRQPDAMIPRRRNHARRYDQNRCNDEGDLAGHGRSPMSLCVHPMCLPARPTAVPGRNLNPLISLIFKSRQNFQSCSQPLQRPPAKQPTLGSTKHGHPPSQGALPMIRPLAPHPDRSSRRPLDHEPRQRCQPRRRTCPVLRTITPTAASTPRKVLPSGVACAPTATSSPSAALKL